MLSSLSLISAYSKGFFPMAHPEENNELYWHNPEKRGIIPLDDAFIIPKNLHKLYNKNVFDLHIDKDFEKVITQCAELRKNDTWISEEIIDMYIELFENGFAHSFEAWQDGMLVGGLYGVVIGKAFFGESMFYHVRDASKIALIFLVQYLRKNNFILLDTQYLNPHLIQFGAYEIDRESYLSLLKKAIKL